MLKVKTAAGDTLSLSGNKRIPKDITKAEAGAATPFKCGAPLEVKVTSARDTRNSGSATSESKSFLKRLFGGGADDEKPLQQLIQASVLGAGGEIYSGFYLKGDKENLRQPPRPTFTIVTTDGKEMASGNMEFG
jgi:hypothetical protein